MMENNTQTAVSSQFTFPYTDCFHNSDLCLAMFDILIRLTETHPEEILLQVAVCLFLVAGGYEFSYTELMAAMV